MLSIKTIHNQSIQGMTSPFYCTASDNLNYYVKGLQANRQSQINEWICAHLAQAFGLPIPTFKLLYVEERLYDILPSNQKTIGIGYAFGSQERAGVNWLEKHHIARLEKPTKRDILVFDKWIRNLDRTAGNHNLIFNISEFELFVIDHNLAFDREFDHQKFLESHLFAKEWDDVCGDWIERETYKNKMKTAMQTFEHAWQTLPEEWRWSNNEHDLPAQRLSKAHINDILNHYENSEFWQSA